MILVASIGDNDVAKFEIRKETFLTDIVQEVQGLASQHEVPISSVLLRLDKAQFRMVTAVKAVGTIT